MHVQQLASLRLWPLHFLANATARNGVWLSASKPGYEDGYLQAPRSLIDLCSSAQVLEL